MPFLDPHNSRVERLKQLDFSRSVGGCGGPVLDPWVARPASCAGTAAPLGPDCGTKELTLTRCLS
eukprot:7480638-Alexandrium_andersonii.AAC.1